MIATNASALRITTPTTIGAGNMCRRPQIHDFWIWCWVLVVMDIVHFAVTVQFLRWDVDEKDDKTQDGFWYLVLFLVAGPDVGGALFNPLARLKRPILDCGGFSMTRSNEWNINLGSLLATFLLFLANETALSLYVGDHSDQYRPLYVLVIYNRLLYGVKIAAFIGVLYALTLVEEPSSANTSTVSSSKPADESRNGNLPDPTFHTVTLHDDANDKQAVSTMVHVQI